MNINDFISSIDNKIYNRIRQSKSDAECRRYLKEHLEAITVTHCCKSDSDQLQAFKKDDLVMLDGNLQVRVVIPEPKILISEDLGGAKMWVETHRCIKK